MTLDRPLSIVAAILLVAAFSAAALTTPSPDPGPQAAGLEDTAAAQGTPAAAPPAAPGQQPVTVADIDRWDKGMAAELEAVHAAAAQLKQAKTADDTLTAMTATQDMSTLEAGAQAAGLERERYNLIRSTLSEAASYLAPSVGGLDTTGLSSDQRAELRRGNAAQLDQLKDRVPPDVVSALTPRAAQSRTKDLELGGGAAQGGRDVRSRRGAAP